MRIRKYRAVDPTQIQLCNNSDGEFVHVNDIELYLIKEREGFNNQINSLNTVENDTDDWHKRYIDNLKNKIEVIDNILAKILYDRN
jgi:hypothetical protein